MKVRLVGILLAIGFCSAGQSVQINFDIDTNVHAVAEPLNLWLNFLNTKDDSLGSKYWNEEEVLQYGKSSYFLIENEANFGLDNYLKLLTYADVKVLSIRKRGDYFKISSSMEFQERNGRSNLNYCFHVYAREKNGEWRLYNPLPINCEMNLNTTAFGYIRYHYPKTHPFDNKLAQKQSDFILKVAKDFQVEIDTIDYYFASTREEIQRIKGFDFVFGDNGEQLPSGKADSDNRIVYANGLNEYYPHEFIHILMNPYFPECHNWLDEGLATYLGMSRGKELSWHLARLQKHLVLHPEIDLNEMLELRTMDKYTDYRYVLGGFIMQKAFEKGGVELQRKMMCAGRSDEDFYCTIHENLNISKPELNSWIRQELKKMFP